MDQSVVNVTGRPAVQVPARSLLQRVLGLFSRAKPAVAPAPRPRAAPQAPPAAERMSQLAATPEDCLAALELTLPPDRELAAAEQELVARVVELGLQHFQEAAQGLRAQPVAALRVLNLVAGGDPDVAELTRTVNHDGAMTAAVLRVSNSAAVTPAGGQEVRTVRDAITRLGTGEVGRVAGAVAARALTNADAKAEYALFAARFGALHATAAACAAGAAQLAMDLRRGRSDMAYLGGMLHDVGKGIALSSIASLIRAGALPRELPDVVIDEALERMHVEIGTEVHLEWSLPQYLTTFCSNHHDLVLPPQAACEELHEVRVTSSLLDLRAGRGGLRTLAELTSSVAALGMNSRVLKVFDRDLVALGDKMRDVLT